MSEQWPSARRLKPESPKSVLAHLRGWWAHVGAAKAGSRKVILKIKNLPRQEGAADDTTSHMEIPGC